MTTGRHTGGCLCGDVRFEASGPPDWVAHCHCASCRRNTGAALATFAGYTQATFAYVKGAPAQFSSSPGVARSFCARCGTSLTYEADWCAGEVHINIGTLDHPEQFSPQRHVFVGEKVPWLHIDDGLPRHAKTSRDE